jgi:Grx4 family monothiol glutaredoxin
MGVVDITSLQQLESLGGIVVVYFWADWSKPCGQMTEIYTKLAAQHPNLPLAKVEAEKVPAVSEKFSIESVPHFLFLKNGAVVDTVEGFNPPELLKKVTKYSQVQVEQKAQTPALTTPSQAAPAIDLNTRLTSLVNSAPVMLFMKGTPDAPQCGFSTKIVNILKEKQAKFSSFNILSDQEVREGLKKFSNWPTYPQLYIEGKLVGGLDIVKELAEQGELEEMLPKAPQSLNSRIEALLKSAPVMLFMKGEPNAPKCGFSSKIVNILNEAEAKFSSFDILGNEEIRQGLKTYSNWPTYPQLYIDGKLVGGLDIVKELHENGELKDMLPK